MTTKDTYDVLVVGGGASVGAAKTGARVGLIEAGAFVDASGDGDLAFLAGASTRYGNNGAPRG